MHAEDYAKLLEDLEHELLSGARSIGALGLPASRFASWLFWLRPVLRGPWRRSTPRTPARRSPYPCGRSGPLVEAGHDVLVVAADEEKEELLRAALPFIRGAPKVIVAGYGHLIFRDPIFRQELAQLLVPSLANGYPNTLPYLHQCLVNAARLDLRGVVAEFGMFKGGTTMFLSRVIERLGKDWPVIGFGTFSGSRHAWLAVSSSTTLNISICMIPAFSTGSVE